MRENNRNSIASMGKLPQFTTMNVIDGQAGLIIYASLIFYSLTIDNILNIIVLLILAGVAIATLTGENGIIQNAKVSKTSTEERQAEEEAILIYDEYQMYRKMCETNGKETNIEEFLRNRKYMYENKEDGIYEVTTDSENKIKIDSNGNLIVNDKVLSVTKVESITIAGATAVNKGSNITLTATLSPENAKYTKIEWSSSNTGIATVTGNNTTCTVTGLGAGSVTITCKVTNNDNTNVTKTYIVAVKDTLSSVAKVGDFVNYDAGNWTSTVAVSEVHGNFGGYTSGKSKNATVNPYQSTNIYSGGWRVFSISGTTVNLIHAGTPAIYCHGFGGDSNVSNSKLNSFCNSNFVNSTFAVSARSINYGDRNSSLLNCGCLYFFADYYENTVQYYVKQDGSINKGWSGPLGFRPIVVLKSGVKTSGLANNGYNQSGWVLTN